MYPFDVPTVTVDDLPTGAVLLDVREPDEWLAGHIADAVHVPMNQLPQHLAAQPEQLRQETPIVVVCKMGGRSAQVTNWLNHYGFDAVNLDGGMLAWAAAGRPMISEDGGAPRVA